MEELKITVTSDFTPSRNEALEPPTRSVELNPLLISPDKKRREPATKISASEPTSSQLVDKSALLRENQNDKELLSAHLVKFDRLHKIQ